MAADSRFFKWRGPLVGIVILPAVVSACLSRPLVLPGSRADLGLNMLGWALLGAGIFMRVWATLYIGGRKSVELAAEGPYRACRHPLYVGSFFIALALAVFLKSPVTLSAFVFAAWVYVVGVIPSEERHALACFGDSYRAYQAVTPRFIPRFSNLGRPGLVEVKVAEVLRELARDCGCLMIGALAEAVAYCRVQPWWPHMAGLP